MRVFMLGSGIVEDDCFLLVGGRLVWRLFPWKAEMLRVAQRLLLLLPCVYVCVCVELFAHRFPGGRYIGIHVCAVRLSSSTCNTPNAREVENGGSIKQVNIKVYGQSSGVLTNSATNPTTL